MPRPSKWRDAGPNMSDAALLVSVEDLINMAMGPDDQNTVNYKLVQMILHILARQMRMLETRVEVKIAEIPVAEEVTETKKKKKRQTSASSSSPSPPRSGRKSKQEDAQERRGSRKSQSKSPKSRDKTGSPSAKDGESTEQRAQYTTERDQYKDRERTKSESDEVKKRGKEKEREYNVIDAKKTGKYKEKVDSAKEKMKSTREPPEVDNLDEDRKKASSQRDEGKRGKSGRMTKETIEADYQKDDKIRRGKDSLDTFSSQEYDRAQPEEKKRPKKLSPGEKSKVETRTPTSTAEDVESEEKGQKVGYGDEEDESSESNKVKKGAQSKYKSEVSAASESKKFKSETSTSEPKRYKSDISALSVLSEPLKYKSDSSALSPISEKNLSPRSGKEDKESKRKDLDRDRKHKEDDKERKHGDRDNRHKEEEDDREKRHGKEMYKTDTKERGMEERGESRDQEHAYRVEPDHLLNSVKKYRRVELKQRQKYASIEPVDFDEPETYRRRHRETIEALREQFVDQYIISESDEPRAPEQNPERSTDQEKKLTPKSPQLPESDESVDIDRHDSKESKRKRKRTKKKGPPEDKAESDDDWTKRSQKERPPKSKYKSDGDEPDSKGKAKTFDSEEEYEPRQPKEKKYKQRNVNEITESNEQGKSKADTEDLTKAKLVPKTTEKKEERRKLGGFLYRKRGSDRISEDAETKAQGKLKQKDKLDTMESEEYTTGRKERSKSATIDKAKVREDTTGHERRPKSADEKDKLGILKTEKRDLNDLGDSYRLTSKERIAMQEKYPFDSKGRKRRERSDSMNSEDDKETASKRRKTDKQDIQDRKDRTADTFNRRVKSSESIDLETDRQAQLEKERNKSTKRKDRVDSTKGRRKAEESEDYDSKDYAVEEMQSEKSERERESLSRPRSDLTEFDDHTSEPKQRKKSAKKRDNTDVVESQEQRPSEVTDSVDLEGRAESIERKKSAKRKHKTDVGEPQEHRSSETMDAANLGDDQKSAFKERKKSARQKDKINKDRSPSGETIESRDLEEEYRAESEDRKKYAKQKDERDKDESQERQALETTDSADLDNYDHGAESKEKKKSANQKAKTDMEKSQEQKSPKSIDSGDIEDNNKTETKERKMSAKQKDKIYKNLSQEKRSLERIDSRDLGDDGQKTEFKEQNQPAKKKEEKTYTGGTKELRPPGIIDPIEVEEDHTSERVKPSKKKPDAAEVEEDHTSERVKPSKNKPDAADKERKRVESLETVGQVESQKRKKSLEETDVPDKSMEPGKPGKGESEDLQADFSLDPTQKQNIAKSDTIHSRKRVTPNKIDSVHSDDRKIESRERKKSATHKSKVNSLESQKRETYIKADSVDLDKDHRAEPRVWNKSAKYNDIIDQGDHDRRDQIMDTKVTDHIDLKKPDSDESDYDPEDEDYLLRKRKHKETIEALREQFVDQFVISDSDESKSANIIYKTLKTEPKESKILEGEIENLNYHKKESDVTQKSETDRERLIFKNKSDKQEDKTPKSGQAQVKDLKKPEDLKGSSSEYKDRIDVVISKEKWEYGDHRYEDLDDNNRTGRKDEIKETKDTKFIDSKKPDLDDSDYEQKQEDYMWRRRQHREIIEALREQFADQFVISDSDGSKVTDNVTQETYKTQKINPRKSNIPESDAGNLSYDKNEPNVKQESKIDDEKSKFKGKSDTQKYKEIKSGQTQPKVQKKPVRDEHGDLKEDQKTHTKDTEQVDSKERRKPDRVEPADFEDRRLDTRERKKSAKHKDKAFAESSESIDLEKYDQDRNRSERKKSAKEMDRIGSATPRQGMKSRHCEFEDSKDNLGDQKKDTQDTKYVDSKEQRKPDKLKSVDSKDHLLDAKERNKSAKHKDKAGAESSESVDLKKYGQDDRSERTKSAKEKDRIDSATSKQGMKSRNFEDSKDDRRDQKKDTQRVDSKERRKHDRVESVDSEDRRLDTRERDKLAKRTDKAGPESSESIDLEKYDQDNRTERKKSTMEKHSRKEEKDHRKKEKEEGNVECVNSKDRLLDTRERKKSGKHKAGAESSESIYLQKYGQDDRSERKKTAIERDRTDSATSRQGTRSRNREYEDLKDDRKDQKRETLDTEHVDSRERIKSEKLESVESKGRPLETKERKKSARHEDRGGAEKSGSIDLEKYKQDNRSERKKSTKEKDQGKEGKEEGKVESVESRDRLLDTMERKKSAKHKDKASAINSESIDFEKYGQNDRSGRKKTAKEKDRIDSAPTDRRDQKSDAVDTEHVDYKEPDSDESDYDPKDEDLKWRRRQHTETINAIGEQFADQFVISDSEESIGVDNLTTGIYKTHKIEPKDRKMPEDDTENLNFEKNEQDVRETSKTDRESSKFKSLASKFDTHKDKAPKSRQAQPKGEKKTKGREYEYSRDDNKDQKEGTEDTERVDFKEQRKRDPQINTGEGVRTEKKEARETAHIKSKELDSDESDYGRKREDDRWRRRKHRETIDSLREKFADQFVISDSDGSENADNITKEKYKSQKIEHTEPKIPESDTENSRYDRNKSDVNQKIETDKEISTFKKKSDVQKEKSSTANVDPKARKPDMESLDSKDRLLDTREPKKSAKHKDKAGAHSFESVDSEKYDQTVTSEQKKTVKQKDRITRRIEPQKSKKSEKQKDSASIVESRGRSLFDLDEPITHKIDNDERWRRHRETIDTLRKQFADQFVISDSEDSKDQKKPEGDTKDEWDKVTKERTKLEKIETVYSKDHRKFKKPERETEQPEKTDLDEQETSDNDDSVNLIEHRMIKPKKWKERAKEIKTLDESDHKKYKDVDFKNKNTSDKVDSKHKGAAGKEDRDESLEREKYKSTESADFGYDNLAPKRTVKLQDDIMADSKEQKTPVGSGSTDKTEYYETEPRKRRKSKEKAQKELDSDERDERDRDRFVKESKEQNRSAVEKGKRGSVLEKVDRSDVKLLPKSARVGDQSEYRDLNKFERSRSLDLEEDGRVEKESDKKYDKTRSKTGDKRREEIDSVEPTERDKAKQWDSKEKRDTKRTEGNVKVKNSERREQPIKQSARRTDQVEDRENVAGDKQRRKETFQRKAQGDEERSDKMSAKEREADKDAQRDKDRDVQKEREKTAKEREQADKREEALPSKVPKGRTPSRTGISVKEEGRGPKGEKVLVVEKGPTTRPDSQAKSGSIEVVTKSQFEALESEVRDLKKKAGPLPMPAMPDNKKLRKELVRGSATLGDTMQAMQVAARVDAAERAIGRMAGLLTQLAAAGALPDDVANQVENVTAEMEATAAEIQAVKQEMGFDGAGAGLGGGLGTGLSAGGGVGGALSAGAGAALGASVGAGGGTPKLGGWPLPLTGIGGRKSVAIDPTLSSTTGAKDGRAAAARPSVTSRASATSRMSKVGSLGMAFVTHNELDDALAQLKEQFAKNVSNMTARATNAAEAASAIAKAVAEKLDIALKLNARITHLHSMVTDYSEQLSGFDVGLTTQMQSFQEQMAVMRNDLQQGLAQLATANNNAETAAVMELSERYESLVSELDHTLHAHAGLTAFQSQLGEELKSLAECVETLREQKADIEEVQDGLRDKADNSRLAGLLTESQFAASRGELERRLDCCYDKFRRQESVWMGAIKDLTGIAEQKAELMQLMAARDNAQQQLRDIKERLGHLAIMLGEPKAALLTRQLSRGGTCGACLLPALQEPVEPSAGRPHALPNARPAPLGEEEPSPPPCSLQPHDDREHTCLRWAGGSHTLITDAVRRVQAEPLDHGSPTSRYVGYGTDGRMYLMEDELAPPIPCLECNPKSIDLMPEKGPEKYKRKFDNLPGEVLPGKVEDGAGDTGGIPQ